ncbi:putative rRNA methyltransferase YqxC [Camellia lanceoleosa]|uniref:rRNA methyltransferase YqxC n=1 Tax=Camellia lanceoleosa TaxID=1840588 RepID=A0ACC0HQQ7_9ERIC|nr:putative rRNA methyltransferase YqxC [Camellia lanceoleosa]
MALKLLKLPISRCCSGSTTSSTCISSTSCSSTFFFFSKSSTNTPLLSVRWHKAHMHFPIRSFVAANKSGKVQLKKKKKRLDEICLERFQQYSRTFIQSWILQGKVFVDGKLVNKAGTPVSDEAVVEIMAEVPKYVCRAGYKLEAAIEQLSVDVTGKVALDSGLSTGGFTDCLLQYGASFVYGVDVGYGQVADKIRRDERVSVVERTNLRYLPGLPQKVDLVTLDLSFISILLVMPAVVNVMKEEATLVTLVKPQFEARRSQVGKGGIVRDPLVHQEVREKIINGVENYGFSCKGWIESPLKGAEGNTEFLVCFARTADKIVNQQVPQESR